MAKSVTVTVESLGSESILSLFKTISETRHIDLQPLVLSKDNSAVSPSAYTTLPSENLLKQLCVLAGILSDADFESESTVLQEVYQIGITQEDFGGLNLNPDEPNISAKDQSELLFLVSAHLEALNSAERAQQRVPPIGQRPAGRRPMTLSEKILAAHDVERKGEVRPGDIIRVDVDWVLASELSWKGMKASYDNLGQPGIFRNDRFWLAGDHLVDPRVMNHPKIEPLVKASEWAKREFKMTDNQGMNYTIMHTEFCRQRAQPGGLYVGSDSHTCSAGSMGALAIGLGVADVALLLITGQTYFQVPESIKIEFTGKPKPGIGGKDVILYILGQLKPRFAISNMTTEFGGITGIFVPDAITEESVQKRRMTKHKSDSVYFCPDSDAQYAEKHIIDLDKVESFVARYPRPDDVVPVSEVEGQVLDGCFIGACTTTEEDIVLAALVLEEALRRGHEPVQKGKRKVVPGSRPILHNLRQWGLDEIYQRAGFDIGVPGCSYCVGMSADQASEDEVWLSSQNRNFQNRMGPGSIGNLASAVTVAASSLSMTVSNPSSLLEAIDLVRVDKILGKRLHYNQQHREEPAYVEPGSIQNVTTNLASKVTKATPSPDYIEPVSTNPSHSTAGVISGKTHLLGDFIDTDALAPNEIITKPDVTHEELGKYCLKHTHPDFWRRVNEHGHNIVVAGKAFGCGSSRDVAVTALQGAGVRCVIARSFAFIYGRNQPNLGLLGFEMNDSRFWDLIADGQDIRIATWIL
ncbi:aconitase iron-sulfur domain-containing protein [Xylariaceae sp. FL0255]|nr:aconitase iron-sulfur domain-containing protein [Xylariaceae sp. FL0255]